MNHDLQTALFNSAAGEQWKRIGVQHHHGICIPLFSLFTDQSCGIGEFLDLVPLIEWCKSINFDVIQLLPLNDTGLDTSPYNGISAFALNPIHLSMHALPMLERVPNYQEKLGKLSYWNRTSRVKHHIVRELKYNFFRKYFDVIYEDILKDESYKKFREKHRFWLESYALFKTLKEKEGWKPWEEWQLSFKSPTDRGFEELLHVYKYSCSFHSFLQYLCYEQMEKVKLVAENNKVFLKGDIPILISRDSADVWKFRHLFFLHLSAGAPPDMYAKEGQYWGFPIYDWEEMEKSRYDWWKERLKAAEGFYHVYRIDHVVGFFRIWAVAQGKSAAFGSFFPADSNAAIAQGKKIMDMMLKSATIFPIGEDLGVVPPEVKQCLYQLGICGTKMMRWERRWDTDGGFINPRDYNATSMTTVSTHDSDTLQLWWRHAPKEARLFCDFKGWDFRPFLSLDRQREILQDSHHSSSLFHINLLQEYLALFPELVSQNPHDERINIPGKILDTNWTYRLRLSIEKLQAHFPLKQMMQSLIS